MECGGTWHGVGPPSRVGCGAVRESVGLLVDDVKHTLTAQPGDTPVHIKLNDGSEPTTFEVAPQWNVTPFSELNTDLSVAGEGLPVNINQRAL